MGPVRMFLSIWIIAGFITLTLELSKWGNFWRKFDEAEKHPEARLLGGPTTFLMFGVVIVFVMWPIRIYYFSERLVKFLWTTKK